LVGSGGTDVDSILSDSPPHRGGRQRVPGANGNPEVVSIQSDLTKDGYGQQQSGEAGGSATQWGLLESGGISLLSYTSGADVNRDLRGALAPPFIAVYGFPVGWLFLDTCEPP
jgi:hypothetical protein